MKAFMDGVFYAWAILLGLAFLGFGIHLCITYPTIGFFIIFSLFGGIVVWIGNQGGMK